MEEDERNAAAAGDGAADTNTTESTSAEQDKSEPAAHQASVDALDSPSTQTPPTTAAAASTSPISQSTTGAYMNPAMKRRLEEAKQNNSPEKQAMAAAANAVSSFSLTGWWNKKDSTAAPNAENGIDTATKSEVTPADSADQEQNKSNAAGNETEAEVEKTGEAYGHGLKPGDHVYRWSHFAYSYPIQIHGIVLAVSEEDGDENDIDTSGADADAEADTDTDADENNSENAKTDGDGAKNDEPEKQQSKPKSKAMFVQIADFGFTRKGDEDAKNTDDSAHAGGTATAPTTAANSRTPSIWEGRAEAEEYHAEQAEVEVDVTGRASVVVPPLPPLPPSADSESPATTSTKSDAGNDDATDREESSKNNNNKQLKRSDESFLAKHLKTGRRLNVITLTDPKDIKKWKKVNYGRGLFGVGGEDEDTASEAENDATEAVASATGSEDAAVAQPVNPEKKTSWFSLSRPTSRCGSPSDASSKPVDDKNTSSAPLDAETSSNTSENGFQTAQAPPPVKPVTMKEGEEAKTLEEMIAAANAVELKACHSPKQRKVAPDATEMVEDKAEGPDVPVLESGVKKSASLGNIWPWKKPGRRSPAIMYAENKDGKSDGSNKEDESAAKKPPKIPKSDPAKIVLARVHFLLENEENDVLPQYHVFNSNSECIAVWCKTGRWSSLQSDVFWHTTAIGNAKSSTLVGLSVAAAQPWLIPAIPIAAVAAIGAPYLVLHQSKKKCEEATRSLTEKFWAQADPEVFVEAIEQWSDVTLL